MPKDLTIDGIPDESSLVTPAARAIARTFKKQALLLPNGGGHGIARTVYQSKRIFRAAAPRLAEELIALALCATDERVKAVCLIACLGNAGIKPSDYDPEADRKAEAGQSVRLDVDRLSSEERSQLRELLLRATPTEAGREGDGSDDVSLGEQG